MIALLYHLTTPYTPNVTLFTTNDGAYTASAAAYLRPAVVWRKCYRFLYKLGDSSLAVASTVLQLVLRMEM